MARKQRLKECYYIAALLNLDIAWCYLMLGNLSELPNATQCLNKCEADFARTYGANLERVEAIKGSKGEESVLLVRMHLLQAIVSYHSGHVDASKSKFNSVKNEMSKLLVPKDALDEVVASGFTPKEARLALRSTGGDVTKAIKHAQQVKDRREEIQKEELERTRKRRKFGKTATGDWVNLGYLETLTKMGYEEKLAALALRHTENDLNASIEVITENPEILLAKDFDPVKDITDKMVESIQAMGFLVDDVKKALIKYKGNSERAIEALTSGEALDSSQSSSSSSGGSASEEVTKEKIEEAHERMKEDLDASDGYLDLTLEDEQAFLDKYFKIIHKS